MKRFLSWLTLIGCYLVFVLVVSLDTTLLSYFFKLYDELSAFLKLIILIVGGSFIVGLTFAPLRYGVPLTISLCEKVCPSEKGTRYLVFGIIIAISFIIKMFSDFKIDYILLAIYGVAIAYFGRKECK